MNFGKAPATRGLGPQTWTCVHCGMARTEAELLWGTHATTIPGDTPVFTWKPECVHCRPDAPPPTVDLAPGVRLPSRRGSRMGSSRPGSRAASSRPGTGLSSVGGIGGSHGGGAAGASLSVPRDELVPPRSPRSPPRTSHGLTAPRANRLAAPALPALQPPRSAPAGAHRSGGSQSARSAVSASHGGGPRGASYSSSAAAGSGGFGGGGLGAGGSLSARAHMGRLAPATTFAPHSQLAAAYSARQQISTRALRQQPDRAGANPLLRARELHQARPKARGSIYGPFNLRTAYGVDQWRCTGSCWQDANLSRILCQSDRCNPRWYRCLASLRKSPRPVCFAILGSIRCRCLW